MRIGIVSNLMDRKGLWCDARILAVELATLAPEINVQLIDWAHEKDLGKAATATLDVLIFLEVIEPDYYPMLRAGGLLVRIPNPEWENAQKLEETRRAFDFVWCKTLDAMGRDEWGGKARLIGFTSPDLGAVDSFPSVQFLHPAGGSIARGTEQVLRAWRIAQRQLPPEYTLTIIDPAITRDVGILISDVERTRILRRLPPVKMLEEQRSHAVHIVCSEYEGHGHTFWEALSLGAHVLATDGAWWSAARGSYEPIESSVLPMRRGIVSLRRVYVEALAEAMVRAVEQPVPRADARSAFCRARNAFRSQLGAAVVELRAKLPTV